MCSLRQAGVCVRGCLAHGSWCASRGKNAPLYSSQMSQVNCGRALDPPQVNPPASTGQAASRALCGTVSAHCAMRHVAPRGAIKRQVATCPVLLSSPVTCWMPSLSRPVCVCVCVCVLCCVVINALCSPSAWDKNRQEFSFCVSCSFPSNCLSASPVGSLFV